MKEQYEHSLSLFQADKRAHHNALERKRRDHIKDSFHGLRDSVPSLQGEKVRKGFALYLQIHSGFLNFTVSFVILLVAKISE